MVQGHAGDTGRLGDVRSEPVAKRERGSTLSLTWVVARPLHSGRNGRHAHIPGAAEDAAVPTGVYDMCGVRWMHAAARGAAVIPSRRRCLIAQSVVQ